MAHLKRREELQEELRRLEAERASLRMDGARETERLRREKEAAAASERALARLVVETDFQEAELQQRLHFLAMDEEAAAAAEAADATEAAEAAETEARALALEEVAAECAEVEARQAEARRLLERHQ